MNGQGTRVSILDVKKYICIPSRRDFVVELLATRNFKRLYDKLIFSFEFPIMFFSNFI